MVDRDTIKYTITEIKKKKGTPYHMANEKLADELYPYIQNEFRDVQMIKYGVTQWFVVSERAKNKVKKQLENKIVEHNQALVEIQGAVNKLN